jgi:hypothetical protein
MRRQAWLLHLQQHLIQQRWEPHIHLQQTSVCPYVSQPQSATHQASTSTMLAHLQAVTRP